MKSSKGRWLRWVGTLASSALFVLLLSRQDWAKTWESLTHAPLWLLPLVFLMYFGGMLLNCLRWYTLLRAQRLEVPLVEVVKMVITGSFASNFLPSTIGGDTVRIIALTRFEVSWTMSVASVVLDRLLNVLAMFTILPFAFVVFGSALLQMLSGSANTAWSVGMAVLGGRAEKWRLKLAGWLARTKAIVQVWMNRPGVLFLTFAISWVSSFVVFVAIWVLARGLQMHVTLVQVMGVMALSYVVSLLPISINGYGLREVTLAALFMQIGATLEQASTLAVVTRSVLLLESLPGALWLSGTVASARQSEEQ